MRCCIRHLAHLNIRRFLAGCVSKDVCRPPSWQVLSRLAALDRKQTGKGKEEDQRNYVFVSVSTFSERRPSNPALSCPHLNARFFPVSETLLCFAQNHYRFPLTETTNFPVHAEPMGQRPAVSPGPLRAAAAADAGVIHFRHGGVRHQPNQNGKFYSHIMEQSFSFPLGLSDRYVKL